MYKIVNVKDYYGGVEEAAHYFNSKWGNEDRFLFYLDAIEHSSNRIDGLPRFYLLLKDNEIVGCFALIVNDFISRHDLMPWFAALYIEEHERGKRLSRMLFDHAKSEAANAGFNNLYLTTNHDGLYEKFGWQRIEDGYDLQGKKTRIYTIPSKNNNK